jgi:hypothetical protein
MQLNKNFILIDNIEWNKYKNINDSSKSQIIRKLNINFNLDEQI